jgi:uncharacterized protein YciI
MRIVYSYTMREEPDRVRTAAPQHAAFWRRLDARGYIGGPFADRSGGLITFEADSNEEAERLIAADPFVQQDLLEASWMKEWITE